MILSFPTDKPPQGKTNKMTCAPSEDSDHITETSPYLFGNFRKLSL